MMDSKTIDSMKDFEYYRYRLGMLKTKRDNYESKWEQLAVFCDPRNINFRVKNPTTGKLSHLIPKTDDTVQLYLPLFTAIMNSMLTPQAYVWHSLKFFDRETQRNYGAALAEENQILFNYRYSGLSNFQSAINEIYTSCAVFGHGIMQVKKDRANKRVVYSALPIHEFYIDKDFAGRINVFYREVEVTYRNLQTLFPNYVPERFKDRQDLKWLDDKMTLVHAIEPSSTTEGKAHSVYLDMTNKCILEDRSAVTYPYLCVRSSVFPSSDDPYGLSPCMNILPSIKALNSLQFNFLKQTDMAGQPTLLTNSDVIDATKVSASGTVVEGGLDDEGRPMVQALRTYADYPALDYQIKQLQEKIKQALFVNFFASFSDTQSRSATDAMLKANEKANLLAPSAERMARELLVPLIDLELQMYGEMGMLPQFPAEFGLQNLNTEFDIVLDTPLLKGQRMDCANNIISLAQNIAQFAGVDPNVASTFNADGAIRALQDIMNVPSNVIHSPEQTNAINEDKAQAAQMQQVVEAMPKVSKAMKDMSEVQQ